MTRDLYLRAAGVGGDWVRGAHLRAIRLELTKRANAGVGIYFCCDAQGQLRYIGSAVRPESAHGVGARLHEHPLSRRANWTSAWILPLKNETPRDVVHIIEGRLITIFDPPDNRRRHTPRAVRRCA
ncbi:hypothetical protein [Corallococcus caeni]|uniref:GIY-YIG nuclease family protein n=1 Tax=Corallococcus caeni TaxID=3082388 RepID=A0ABQ6QYF9_9BACT|nr:hypothetical protein ASNO1_53250 [Corallococcus sp. NO1]